MRAKLSSDLWLTVLHFCDKSILLKISTVSKYFHELSLPFLYRDVDLSIHNSVISYTPWFFTPGWNEKPWSKGLWDTEAPLRSAQETFLETLIKHPEYAPWVRNFTWTFIFAPETENHNLAVEDIPYPHDHTWEVLQSLQNVQTVDLASDHYLVHHEYVMNSPENLFPAAKSVKISRMMDVDLVRNIVSHCPGRLEELSMNNVQFWGFYTESGFEGIDIQSKSIGRRGEGSSRLFPPGPIHGIFDSLTQLSNLARLYLRKVGHPIALDVRHCYPEAEVAVYSEWAHLITSVKPHLQRLTFEQAEATYSRRHRIGGQVRRPMDQNFHDYLLPIFIVGGWERLERLEIIGVGRWQNEDPIVMNDLTKDAIRNAIGPQAELLIVENAPHTARFWEPP